MTILYMRTVGISMIDNFSEVSLLRGSSGFLTLNVSLHLSAPVLWGFPRSRV